MIFYFSGAGNSYWAAKKLAEKSGEGLVSIADALNKKTGSLYGVKTVQCVWLAIIIVLNMQ